MPDSPTARKRQLGIQLRRAREAAAMLGSDVAERLGWSHTKISRIETGRTTITAGEVEALCDVLGIDDAALREALTQLARESRKRGWWQPYTKVLPKKFTVLIDLESAASTIYTFQPDCVPGLLQTPDYARTLIRKAAKRYVDAEIDHLVQVRMARKDAITRDNDPAEMWAIIGEEALTRPVGSGETQRAQLKQLLELAERANITVQVLPTAVGAYAGIGSGGFTVLEFDAGEQPLVHVDTIGGSMYLESPDEFRLTRQALDRLQAAALDPEASAATIQDLLKEP